MAINWTEIEIEFIKGTAAYDELAARYGVSPGALRQRSSRGKWKEKRNALSQAVTKSVLATVAEERAEQLAKMNADDMRISGALRMLVGRTIQKAAAGTNLSPQDIGALGRASDLAQKIGRLALGAETSTSVVQVAEVRRKIIEPAHRHYSDDGDDDDDDGA